MADFVEFKLVGAERFILDLVAWRDHLRAAAQAKAVESVQRVVEATVAAYPFGPTGNLKKGVRVVKTSDVGSDRVFALARTAANHSHLYEWGTVGRQNKSGWYRGFMPRNATFIPIAIRERARFVEELRALLGQAVPAIGPGSPDVRTTSGGR